MLDASVDQGCPACGSKAYSPTEFKPQLKDNRYTERLYQTKIHLRGKKAEIESRLCSDCNVIYFANFVTVDEYREFFHNTMPIHNLGWRQFLACFDPNERHKIHMFDKLWSHINKDGKINSYAEVMCPFNGLMPLFINGLTPPNVGWDDRLSEMIDLSLPAHDRQPLRGLHSYLNKSVKRLYKMGTLPQRAEWTLRLLKRRLRPVPPQTYESLPIPNELILISEVSPFFWGINCHALGSSCTHCLSHFAGAKMVTFDEYKDSPQGAIDCIGFFFTLDHIRDPLAAILKACGIAKKVVIVNHHPDHAGLQHPFVLGDEFWSALKTKLPSHKISDASHLLLSSGSKVAYVIE